MERYESKVEEIGLEREKNRLSKEGKVKNTNRQNRHDPRNPFLLFPATHPPVLAHSIHIYYCAAVSKVPLDNNERYAKTTIILICLYYLLFSIVNDS